LPNIDIVQQAGSNFKMLSREVATDVADGFLSIQFFDNDPKSNSPKLSAIEVIKVAGKRARLLSAML